MTGQPNRLPAEGDHRFHGALIDRSRPLAFRLDGRILHGFAGDTVLSAALASGLLGAGTDAGGPLGLDERFAPPVLPAQHAQNPAAALPMQRTPALDGLDLVTLGAAGDGRWSRRLDAALARLPARQRAPALRGNARGRAAAPWLDALPDRHLAADLAVIGGGVAGIGAALAAAGHGARVVLVERHAGLGGSARFFGSMGEEESPDDLIARLERRVAEAGVTVLRGAEAVDLAPGRLRLSRVELEDGLPVHRAIAIEAPRLVLATGAVERLPVFAGNRRPGVVGALAAFDRAERYGVWVGRHALMATVTSLAYRLATLARNAGVEVERIADTRLSPQSRFIEFAKAYGIPMLFATRPEFAAAGPRRGAALRIRLGGALRGAEGAGQEFAADQLVVAGGWQPDLALWHAAGGASRWDAALSRLVAHGPLPGIALAGAAAGYRNTAACLASGEAAAAALFGREPIEIDDPQIAAIHETPDDPTPLAAAEPTSAAYLDGGASLLQRPAVPTRRPRLALAARARRPSDLADTPRPLALGDIAAAVQLGLIPPDVAPTLARERGLPPLDLVALARQHALASRGTVGVPQPAGGAAPPPSPDPRPPAFLAGRFGPDPLVLLVEADDGRRFAPGCLIQPDADHADPLTAIGAVFAPAPPGRSGGLALLAHPVRADGAVVVRDISGPVAARVRAVPPAETALAPEIGAASLPAEVVDANRPSSLAPASTDRSAVAQPEPPRLPRPA